MKNEFKNIALSDFDIKQEADSPIAEFTGHAAIFGNIDSDEDIIIPGAFAKTLIKRPNVKLLYQHDTRKVPGIIDELREDHRGLFIKGRTINTTLGRNVAEEMREGAIDKFSIGFRTIDAEVDKSNIRTIKEVELFEVSLVTFPANEKAAVASVKAANEINSVRDFEDFLRDAGYSRKHAKYITSHGFISEEKLRDADNTELVALLTNFTNKIRN